METNMTYERFGELEIVVKIRPLWGRLWFYNSIETQKIFSIS